MKVLITNHHLLDYTGSEIFTLELSKFLKKKGFDVFVYSKFINKLSSKFKELEIPLITNLELIKKIKFDIAHVHHNISAYEVRYFFPNLPIIYLSHGIIPFLEQPPITILDIDISYYLAVSEEVKKNLILNYKIPKEKVEIFRNIVDSKIFFPISEINEKPKNALILSSKIDSQTESIIREALYKLNIKLNIVGQRFGMIEYYEIPKHINNADIVFSLGRGVIETMMCGRIPIVYDYQGGDGVVTTKNIKEIMKNNFSGRRYKLKFTVNSLIKEINKYEKESAKELRNYALKYFDGETNTKKLIKIYEKVINIPIKKLDKKQYQKLENIIQIIDETKGYAYNFSNNLINDLYSNINKQESYIQNLETQLNTIKSAKFFKLWQTYCAIRKKIIGR